MAGARPWGLEAAEGCALVGMVHLGPLPGSPGWQGDLPALIDAAARDAERLIEAGFDALIVENMGDVPYLKGAVAPETVAAMTLATDRVVRFGVPVGVQVLAGANREALGVAAATGARFIRAEGFAFAHVADEGWLDACAGPLLRARASLGADVRVWADVKKKHAAHAVTADLTMRDAAEGTRFAGADALVVTGVSTGRPTALADVEAAKQAGLPVLVGSGVTPQSAASLAAAADGLIVGSYVKESGDWRAPVDLARATALVRAARGRT